MNRIRPHLSRLYSTCTSDLKYKYTTRLPKADTELYRSIFNYDQKQVSYLFSNVVYNQLEINKAKHIQSQIYQQYLKIKKNNEPDNLLGHLFMLEHLEVTMVIGLPYLICKYFMPFNKSKLNDMTTDEIITELKEIKDIINQPYPQTT